MDKETMLIEEIKMLLDHISVTEFCNMCDIHRSYFYKLIKTMSRYEIYKKYCG